MAYQPVLRNGVIGELTRHIFGLLANDLVRSNIRSW
jgi:hypothetical protein